MSQLLTILKPQLITWVLVIRYLPLVIRMTLIGAAFGGMGAFFLTLLGFASFTLWWPFIYSGCISLLVTLLIILFIYTRTYASTEFKFFADHLEYGEGFWTIEHKTIAYRHITQVNMRQGLIQRMYGLGSIYLAVPSGIAQRGRFSGILIHDIKEPEKVYKAVQNILETGHS